MVDLEAVATRARGALADVRAYLATDEGRALRKRIATGLILTAPLIARLPMFRASPLGRLITVTGGAAAIVKIAELVRDWEPGAVVS